MTYILNFLKSKFIETLALIISVINLFLYYKTIKKEKVKLLVEQDSDESYSFSFVWFQRFNIVFFHVSINNVSKSDTSISKIKLCTESNNIYFPSEYKIKDHFNENGITLYTNKEHTEGLKFDLASDNLLNNLRIPAYGNINGYLVFFGVPVISQDKIFNLIIETPTKCFKKEIKVSPLPQNLSPLNP